MKHNNHLQEYIEKAKRSLIEFGESMTCYVIGSWSLKQKETNKDRDVLIVLKNDFPVKDIPRLREKLVGIFGGNNIYDFFFHAYYCDKCSFTKNLNKIHIILIREDSLLSAIKESDWIVYNWSQLNCLIYGSDYFPESKSIDSNISLVDEYDGIPGLLRNIELTLISKNPQKEYFEYIKMGEYLKNRLNDIINQFNIDCEEITINNDSIEDSFISIYEKGGIILSEIERKIKAQNTLRSE